MVVFEVARMQCPADSHTIRSNNTPHVSTLRCAGVSGSDRQRLGAPYVVQGNSRIFIQFPTTGTPRRRVRSQAGHVRYRTAPRRRCLEDSHRAVLHSDLDQLSYSALQVSLHRMNPLISRTYAGAWPRVSMSPTDVLLTMVLSASR